ncbi:MAG TPA: heme exporter protein CcmD [Gammaproteobacteria bacterium]|nr:heme exporter protein CcmD [Gammaproteobacteria bacterium]
MMIDHIIHMGGYGPYVWTAFGATLFVFGFNVFLFVREKNHVKKILQHLSRQSL